MFGAKKFQFYVESANSELETCLKKYEQLGVVDVQRWSLPEPLLHPGVSLSFYVIFDMNVTQKSKFQSAVTIYFLP